MANTSQPQHTQDERILAAVAHAGIALPMWGTIAAFAIWATQRQRSPFVAFQSLQAAVYHLLALLGSFLVGFCYMCSAIAPLAALMINPSSQASSTELDPLFSIPFVFSFALILVAMFAWLVLVAYGLLAAVTVLRGREFRYVIIGRTLESYLAAV